MIWADFYLVCFLIGLILSTLSFVFGHAHLHIGHGHGHVHAHGGAKGGVSFFNFGTATAFLAWFGGAGFLMTRYSSVWVWLSLAAAVASGLAGAALVFWFLAKLMATERSLDPADFTLVGALGRLSSPIREGGTGEMIFSQQGTRRSIGARSDGAGSIPNGTEVVITRYERGIAYVRRWDDLAGQ
jgi:membrane protein implicated in regulation of membrane protease activity